MQEMTSKYTTNTPICASMLYDEMLTDIELAQSGDIQAYERLIDKSKNLVTSIALSIVKDIDDSEEVAQQVFISLWKNLKTLKQGRSFLPWLRQSTRYCAYNFIRDSKKSSRVNTERADILLSEIADPSESSESLLIKSDTHKLLNCFIDSLASEDREIVLLFYREEQSSQQVAKLLDISSDNVRKKLSRARRSLKYDLLEHASNLIFTSAPAVGFSSLVTALIAPSAPAVAVSAVLWSSKVAIKYLDEQAQKAKFTKYRNELIAWILVWSVFITAGYELTTGWIGPVTTYTGFAIGLAILMYRSMRFLHLNAKRFKSMPARMSYEYAIR
jgi:RNA polymerase sigma factor (sigma-70 family)